MVDVVEEWNQLDTTAPERVGDLTNVRACVRASSDVEGDKREARLEKRVQV